MNSMPFRGGIPDGHINRTDVRARQKPPYICPSAGPSTRKRFDSPIIRNIGNNRSVVIRFWLSSQRAVASEKSAPSIDQQGPPSPSLKGSVTRWRERRWSARNPPCQIRAPGPASRQEPLVAKSLRHGPLALSLLSTRSCFPPGPSYPGFSRLSSGFGKTT